MLNLKNKISYQTSGAESSAKQLSPRPVFNKSKKGKETKLPPTQNLNRDAQMNKVKHKAGSKSNLQFYQQKHNNSPIKGNNEENQSRCINAYSFTNLLQKNLKTQQFSIHSNTSSLDIQSLPSAIPGSSEFKKPYDSKKILSNTYITPACISTSHHRDSTIREQSSSSNTILFHQHSKSRDKESQNEKRTSIKLVNMNKLSNTPKLKDMRQSKSKDCKEKDNIAKEVKPRQYKDQEKEKIQNKTFRAVLNSNINKSLQEKEINLECSEKMYKFIKENSDFQDQNRKNYNGVSSNSKSNLLSTGFLNIGNPLQNYDGLLSYRATQRSKQSLGSKQIPGKSISEDYINQFIEEDSLIQGSDIPSTKLSLLLERVNSLQFYYSNSLDRYDFDDFIQTIQSPLNQEKGKTDRFQHKINCLTGFKDKVLSELSSLIKKISEFSQNIVSQLNYSIKVLEDSKKSTINWSAIQNDFSKKDRMSILMSKNQILVERLKQMSSSSIKSSIKSHKKFQSMFSNQSIIDQIQKELIQQETFISDRQTLSPVVCLTPLILGQLELIDSKILDFRDNMSQMDKQWLQLSVQ